MFRTESIAAVIACIGVGGVMAACAPESGAGGTAAGDPSSAVTITVAGWRLEHAASIGGAEAPEREMLFTVPAVAESGRGEIYVLNAGHQSVLAFDSAGRYLRTIGREGRGPGEFISPGAIVSTGDDALFVLDAPESRISRFQVPDGGFLAAVPLQDPPGVPTRMEPGPDGSLMVEFASGASSSAPPRPVLARVTPETGVVSPLVELDTVAQVRVNAVSAGRRVTRFIRAPFAPNPSWTSDGQGGVLFGSGAEFTVYRATPSGVKLAFRADAEPRPVTTEERTSFLESRLDLKDVAREIPFPSTQPYFTALRMDPRGMLWVRVPSREERQVWEVRERTGRKRGEFSLPREWRLVGLGRNSVYVIENDESGGEVLHRYRLAS
jgi:6-bladed beta-propeller